MEVLPAGGGPAGRRREDEARREDVEEEAVPEVPRPPALSAAPPAERPRGSRDSQEGDEDSESGAPRGGRTSRTASLVSGLLTELYSCTEEDEAAGGGRWPGGRQRRRDSLDSSTEASGSDVVLGGRGGAGDSRLLQELRERPSQRHQRLYLRQKGEGGLGGESPPRLPTLRRSPVRTWTEQPSALILRGGHLLCYVAHSATDLGLSSSVYPPLSAGVVGGVAAGLRPAPHVFVEAQGEMQPKAAVRTGLEFLLRVYAGA